MGSYALPRGAGNVSMGDQVLEPLDLQVLRTIRKYGMLPPGVHVLLGVSGGPDSVALLHCLSRLAGRTNWKLTVAHYNHRIRGAEADADEDFVRSLAARLQLEFFSERAPEEAGAGARRENFEQAAGRARYDFLRRAAVQAGARRIAVGHTMNDQAETVLARLLRGSGSQGLSGIHPVVGGLIVRPLLECTREGVETYLERLGADYREDRTNQDLRYQRNRIRHELIPYLETAFNRRVVGALARQAELARETAAYLAVEAQRSYRAVREAADAGIALPLAALEGLPAIMRKLVVRQALAEIRGSLRGITAGHVEDVLELCRQGVSGKRTELPGGGIVLREFESLVFMPGAPAAGPDYQYELCIPGRCRVPEAGLEFMAEISEQAPADAPRPGEGALLDGDRIAAPLIIRPRRPGDRYGGPGHRKVKKVLQASRIPVTRRDRLPVVVSGDAVVWVPGLRASRHFAFRAWSSTRSVVVEAKDVDER
jgi:tRNA(Ile)-lysidine synthase